LPPQVGRDLAALELAVAGVLDGDVGSRNRGGGVEERNALAVARA
jgi:hypothetical protein